MKDVTAPAEEQTEPVNSNMLTEGISQDKPFAIALYTRAKGYSYKDLCT